MRLLIGAAVLLAAVGCANEDRLPSPEHAGGTGGTVSSGFPDRPWDLGGDSPCDGTMYVPAKPFPDGPPADLSGVGGDGGSSGGAGGATGGSGGSS